MRIAPKADVANTERAGLRVRTAALILAATVGLALLLLPLASAEAQRVPRRDRLSVCVKPAGGATVDEAKALETVRSVLDELAQYQYWWRHDFTEPSVVELNCPHAPVLLQPGVTVTHVVSSSRHVPNMPVVKEFGAYQVIVVVLPDAEMARLFPGFSREYAHLRRETEETMCEGHACVGGTTGLYMAPGDVVDRDLVRSAFTRLLGLDRAPYPGEPATAAERKPTPLTIPDPGKPYPAAGTGPGSADLVVADLVVAPVSVVGGRDATISYTVRNLGPARATGVRVFNRQAQGVGLRGVAATRGGCAYQPQIVCDVGNIEPGGEVRFTVDALPDTTADGEGSYRVQVLAREPDPNPRDNTAALPIVVMRAPELDVKVDPPIHAAPVGQPITYTVTVMNAGSVTVADVPLVVNYDPVVLEVTRLDRRCPEPLTIGGARAATPRRSTHSHIWTW